MADYYDSGYATRLEEGAAHLLAASRPLKSATGTWVEWDVTSLVTGSGTYGFVLAGTSRDASTSTLARPRAPGPSSSSRSGERGAGRRAQRLRPGRVAA